MDRRCSYCGISVGDLAECPLCGTRVMSVNLRRSLLWALVLEEYLVLLLMMVRFRFFGAS